MSEKLLLSKIGLKEPETGIQKEITKNGRLQKIVNTVASMLFHQLGRGCPPENKKADKVNVKVLLHQNRDMYSSDFN